jgi:hypothetical protein
MQHTLKFVKCAQQAEPTSKMILTKMTMRVLRVSQENIAAQLTLTVTAFRARKENTVIKKHCLNAKHVPSASHHRQLTLEVQHHWQLPV